MHKCGDTAVELLTMQIRGRRRLVIFICKESSNDKPLAMNWPRDVDEG